MVDVRFERVLALPTPAIPNTLYFVKPVGATSIELYVTGTDGVPFPVGGIGVPTAENTLASSTLVAGEVLGVSAIFTGLYSRLSSIAARSQAQADRLADLDTRVAALEAA